MQEENNYYTFGLKHKGYNYAINSTNIALKRKFGGKELDDALGLNSYDFGARNYDAALGRWMNIDPLADFRYEITSYNYVQNSPMFIVDPDGLTDYKLNKETGEVEKVADTDDPTDRVVKTDKDGNVKKKGEGFLGFLVRKSERGKSKTAFGGIEKGILKDGQNFKTDDNIFEIRGDGQATVEGVKSFTLQLSEYVGKEIKGFSYSSDGASGEVTDVVLGKYINNDRTTSYGSVTELNKKYGANFSFNNVIQQFHTHPDGKLGATQSNPELSTDVKNLQHIKPSIPNATFIVLYRINGQKKPAEYDYTHEYRPQKK
ncbi:RHS repeat-associated core domain-containing protein [Zhouia sp. PK063]|uniref:RHS repeat-associated core domain-containing protein n=1 Tax=Zhouia sp. PK063 TaxID=3373602 RepID=UPI0037A9991B